MSYSTHRDGKPYPFVIRMDAELHELVKARAAAEERSMAQMIRWALRCYVASPLHPAPADPGEQEG